MKIQAYILKDTGAALRLANRRQNTEDPVTEVWVPRSVIPHLKKFGNADDHPRKCEAEIEGWFARKTPELQDFKEL